MCGKIVGVAVETLVGANVGVETVGAEMVYGDFGLWQGFIPKIEGKRRRSSGEHRLEVVLAVSDRSFRLVGAMGT